MPLDASSSSAFSAVNDLSRYDRQMLLPQIGVEGQKKLAAAKVLLVGCGGLGTNIASVLARAGVGHLVLADRDVVDITNLQRQVLFDEADVREGLPKAEAAKRKLAVINSQVAVTAVVDDVNHTNVEKFAAGCNLILDGLDNFETRYLLNDCAVKLGLPYIYGGAVGTAGLVYAVLPHTRRGDTSWEGIGVAGPCLRCIFEQAPPPGSSPTCDTVGVLGPLVAVVANLQVTQTLKILTAQWQALTRALLSLDLWANTLRQIDVSHAYVPGQCPCCGQRRFEFLEGRHASGATVLCGQDAVQISPTPRTSVDLPEVSLRLGAVGEVAVNSYVLRVVFRQPKDVHLTLFADGRAIIKGTRDPAAAKRLYAQYVGL
jgi:molybdopterin-synthase adenylyltransferase